MKKSVAAAVLVFLFLPAAAFGQDITRIWKKAVEETRLAEDYYRQAHEILVTISWDAVSWDDPAEVPVLIARFEALRDTARRGAELADASYRGFCKAAVSWECLCDITRENDPDNWAAATYNAGVTADNVGKSSDMRQEYERLLMLITEILDELNACGTGEPPTEGTTDE